MSNSNLSNLIKPVVLFGLVTIAASLIGAYATFSTVNTWYQDLQHPPLTPPDWIFSPVWTTLYILMAVSGVLTWRKADKSQIGKVASIYGIQIGLNALWPIVFFAMMAPVTGLVVITALLATLAYMTRFYWGITRPAGILLLPYFLWVFFATYLNAGIVVLN